MSLIARLRTEQPSRELDEAIARSIGWKLVRVYDRILDSEDLWHDGTRLCGGVPHYTSNLQDADTLADPKWEMHIIRSSTVNGVAVEFREPSEFGWTQGPPVYRGEHQSEAVARTIAALLARGVKE